MSGIDSRAPRLLTSRLRAIGIVGGLCSLLTLVAGWSASRLLLGDAPAARQHVTREAQAIFTATCVELQQLAVPFRRPIDVEEAAGGNADAVRRLFDRAAMVRSADLSDGTAISVYGISGQPLAWGGRPSDVPGDRLQDGETWFVTQGAIGLRLVYLAPVIAPDGRRVGTVTTERSLDTVPPGAGGPGEFVLASTSTPVGLELTFESGRTVPAIDRFDVLDPAGNRLVVGTVDPADLARTSRRWSRATVSAGLIGMAVTVMLLCGPILTWRRRLPSLHLQVAGLAVCALAVIAGRALLRLASPADYSSADLFSGAAYASALAAPLLTSPFDFLLTALTAAALLVLVTMLVGTLRLRRRHRRVAVSTPLRRVMFVSTQLLAGVLLVGVFLAHRAFVTDTISNTALDLLHFSLHPWDPARLALQVGMVVWHGVAVGLGLVTLRAAGLPWRLAQRSLATRLPLVVLWVGPWLAWAIATRGAGGPALPLLATVLTSALAATAVPVIRARYRHGSQAFRLLVVALAAVVPALACYPVVFTRVVAAKRELVETRYAPQAINQRQTIQRLVQESLTQIDSLPSLDDIIGAQAGPEDDGASAERAFQLWRTTGLAEYPITSSIELFDGEGRLISRFAFNLPDDLTTAPRADDEECGWTLYEEVSPFFAEERRVLHAGRALCSTADPGGPKAGAIIVHAMLDYANLPFIASQSPYVELLRPGAAFRDESLSGRDLEYAVYGWSGRPLYASSGTAWELSPETLARVGMSREPVWTTLERRTERYGAYLLNDRGGIYALGFPLLSPLGHLVNLAEVVVLAAVASVVMLLCMVALDFASGRATSGRALLREIRASFYRKLFLAFVAAAVVPVVTLAVLTRNYVADELRANVEEEAIRTVAAARRVVEDLVIPRASDSRQAIDDNLMVWVSRLIDQDVNVFRGTRLQATSERNLFASGVLPMRTPADVYGALTIRRDATAILTEQVGALTYLVAATPLTTRQFEGMLTVPLTLRQQDIEGQIDTLNRMVLLGAVLFILAGAGIGYSLAERIADPVNRLTRATRRIARGELDVRIAATSSDELRRLVHDFNRMAEDLQSQRAELERTHRLEAWAEMARQVAHEIKNPLTPIQLNAEHLRRVHQDRGRPLSPTLEDCVGNILTQVALLRAIASEFSNFASSPVVQRAPTVLAELVNGIVTPYAGALQDKITFDIDVSPDLPRVLIDRTLLARAFTNVLENALHAMPEGGTLRVVAGVADHGVAVQISDTGAGMDPQALGRAFEPYFSTKMSGTGLGLPIARRNIELSGGTVEIGSVVGRGTTVTMTLPVVDGRQ